MSKSFVQRRHKSPDYDIEVWITGVRLGNTGKVHWNVIVENESDSELVAEILDRAAIVLRKK